MPYSDALAYFDGSGASSGPLTSTATTLTGVSQSGTTLTYTVATGQLLVGDAVTLAGGGYTTKTVVVSAILTGAGLTGTASVNISQTVTTTTATVTPSVVGDPVGAAGTIYSQLELDFGAPNSGAGYPWIAQFPSLTEKGYTFPPEHPGAGGSEYGVHVMVMAPYNTANSFSGLTIDVASNATASATTVIATRVLTQAQLAVGGADYFIPVPQQAVLEFMRLHYTVGTGNPTAGYLVSYWGPRTGGES